MSNQSTIALVLANLFDKDKLVKRLQQKPEEVTQAIEIMLRPEQPQGWRATWVLKSIIKPNDPRILPKLDQLITSINNRPDGHQRELLHLVEKFTLTDEQEGMLFEICLSIWGQPAKSASVRYKALRHLAAIIQKYPELYNEINHVLEDEYFDALTPGARKVARKLVAGLKKS